MIFTTLVFAAASIPAAFVGAQTSTAGISSCVLSCASQGASSAGCSGITDLTCMCTTTDFQEATLECLQSQCTSDDLSAGMQLAQQYCSSVSGATIIGTATATSTSSYSSSATGTTSTSPATVTTTPTSSRASTSSSTAETGSSTASYSSAASSATVTVSSIASSAISSVSSAVSSGTRSVATIHSSATSAGSSAASSAASSSAAQSKASFGAGVLVNTVVGILGLAAGALLV